MCPATLAVHMLLKNYTITIKLIRTTLHVDGGAGTAVVGQDIHNGRLSITSLVATLITV